MKIIAYQTYNNKVSLLVPSPSWNKSFEELAEKDVPFGAKWKILDTEDFNFHDVFFEATEWCEEKGIDINILKAKEIWLNRYRTARTPLLEKLDLEYMRADEAENLELKKEIAAKKQALRDVTKTELPDTLEGIKATWPEILGNNPFNK